MQSLSFSRTARRATMGLAAAGLAAGLGLSGAPGAQAAPNVAVSCSTAGQLNFQPGVQIIPLPQQATLNGEGSCTDNSGVGIRSAKLSASFYNFLFSCVATPSSGGSGSGTIEWTLDDGSKTTSKVDMKWDHTVLNTGHISGHIRQGMFAGEGFNADLQVSLFQGIGECTVGAPMGGVKNAGASGTFAIG
ncbi:hypothetical protein [Streptomyces sp. DH24]|uniref:hypothetical protein n=1 Tax=Streptomyces sp. DH24 TaxID=3040123 RepID=UPI0024418E07|nr:hypothetical protein [Streptomyces sp. DH24]MDG9720669.1 hypothetical protein [Streptomyces sp. DH24]